MTTSRSYIRRAHLKSRNGCDQCKKRRVKCDEKASPTEGCGPCAKRRIACSFNPTPQPQHPVVAEASTFTAASRLDMDLIYNFTANTGRSLSDYPHLQECFSNSLMELGLKHDFLLHAILALSAFHRVSQFQAQAVPFNLPFPKEQYILAAHSHHTTALHNFSQLIPTLDLSNCHALFGCAILLFITSLARPRDGEDEEDCVLGISDWMILIRGVAIISHDPQLAAQISTGPLADFSAAQLPTSDASSPVQDDQIFKEDANRKLEELSIAIGKHSDSATNTTCQSSITSLHAAFDALGKLEIARAVLKWPAQLSREYMTLLEEKNDEALLVLAHYCVLVQTLDHRWWIKGWPSYTLGSIRLMLREKWLIWLEWPLKRMSMSSDVSA